MSAFTMNSIIERLEEDNTSLKAENESLKQRVVAMTNQLAGNRKENKKILEARDAEIAELKSQLSEADKNWRLMCGERNTTCKLLKEAYDNYTSMKENLNDVIEARDYKIVELEDQLNEIVNDRDADMLQLQNDLNEAKVALEAMRINWNVSKAYTDEEISKRNTEITALKKSLAEQIDFTERAITHASNTEGEMMMKNAELTARVGMLSELSERQANTIHDIQIEMGCKHDQLTHTKAQLAHANEMLTAIGTASSYIANILSHKQ
jgi:chromosome segregation ATPase